MKNLDKWNPFKQLLPMTAGINELNEKEFAVPEWMSKKRALSFSQWKPQLEIEEESTQYRLTLVLNKVEKENIHVSIEQDQLQIEAERHWENDSPDDQDGSDEAFTQTYKKTVMLPSLVNRDQISIEFKDEVLTMVLPKFESGQKELKID